MYDDVCPLIADLMSAVLLQWVGVYVTTQFQTFDPFAVQPNDKPVSPLLNRSESESGSVSRRAWLGSGSISRRGQKVGRAYTGQLGGQRSVMNRVREQ